jgi:hypothetical protein
MTIILFSGFLVSISAASVLAILTVIRFQGNCHIFFLKNFTIKLLIAVTFFFPFVNTCGFLQIPSTLPYVLGSLVWSISTLYS